MKKANKSRSAKTLRGKTKKQFSFKEKVVIALCAMALSGSTSAIITQAAITWSPPAYSGSSIGPSSSSMGPQGCGCGSANKTYSCSDTSFGVDTFCSIDAKRSFFPRVINFPEQGQAVGWTCSCFNGDGQKIKEAKCWAERKGPGRCSEDTGKTFILEKEVFKNLFYDSNGKVLGASSYIYNKFFDNLCSSGRTVFTSTLFPSSHFDNNDIGGCITINYKCECSTKNIIGEPAYCNVKYCYGQTAGSSRWNRKCGDGFLDKELNEECERVQREDKSFSNILFGHTCADRGLCGVVKCTDICGLDYSGCYSCPSESGGVKMN